MDKIFCREHSRVFPTGFGHCSEILSDSDILTVGNVMRMKRNRDLYDDGAAISKKEVAEYILFVGTIIDKARRILE